MTNSETHSGQLHIGIVGLGFGAQFLPIYLSHPGVRAVSIVDTDPRRLAAVAQAYGVDRTHPSLDSLLTDPDVDAVHLLSRYCQDLWIKII